MTMHARPVAPRKATYRDLGTSALLMLGFGFLHAWSIFLEPLQSSLERSRSTVSAIFSLATVCFTVGMLVGPELRVRLPRRSLATGVCLLAAAGNRACRSGLLRIGSGWLRGHVRRRKRDRLRLRPPARERCLSEAARTGHRHVSSYALGPVLFSGPLEIGVRALGITATLLVTAAFVGLIGVIQVTLLPGPVMSSTYTEDAREVVTRQPPRTFWLLWLGFLLGSASGLMAIGHAAGIVVAYGGGPVEVAAGTANSRRQRSRAPRRRLAQRLPLDQAYLDLGRPALRGGAVCAGAGGQYAHRPGGARHRWLSLRGHVRRCRTLIHRDGGTLFEHLGRCVRLVPSPWSGGPRASIASREGSEVRPQNPWRSVRWWRDRELRWWR
jgi:hypothetical protein